MTIFFNRDHDNVVVVCYNRSDHGTLSLARGVQQSSTVTGALHYAWRVGTDPIQTNELDQYKTAAGEDETVTFGRPAGLVPT